MNNLKKLIAQWRNITIAAGVPPETIDELEHHLRETAQEFVRSGLTVPEAFQRAVKQLGTAPAIASEFRKLREPIWLPVKLATGAGGMTALAMAILLIARFDAGRSGFLLASHVFMVTLGYTATFLLGGLGICFVGQRCFSDFSPIWERSLTRITFGLGCVAAVLTAAGIILAMFWAKAEWGRYWAWDPKETGGFCVMVWLICFLAVHRFRRMTARRVLVLSVMGNIVVSLAWFGANLVGGPRSYGMSNYWWFLLAAIISHIAVFLVGLAPAGWLRPHKM